MALISAVLRRTSSVYFSRQFSTSSIDLLQSLQERGFVSQTTNDDGLRRHLAERPRVIYAGFDPTADSLHLGNLLVLMALRHFQDHGHKPICLLGGATGLIGDPSGRSTERPLMDDKVLATNMEGISKNLQKFLRFDASSESAVLVNNVDWYKSMTTIEYLRDVGRHFRMGAMLAKDSVESRLNSAEGMSYMEFSYQTLQAHDFFHLHKQYECTVQLGGSDQYGNITAGTDYIRRRCDGTAFGLTLPLLTTSSGQKFGKSAGNAIWLAREKTSPFQVYQYFLNVSDSDVGPYLKLFTTLSLPEITTLVQSHTAQPELRLGQRQLAFSVTSLLHGEEEAKQAESTSIALFAKEGAEISLASLEGAPTIRVKPDEAIGLKIADFVVQHQMIASKREFGRLVANGGVYVNGTRVTDSSLAFAQNDFPGNTCVVRIGKKRQTLIILI